MEEKFTAIYVMAREEELEPEHRGSYEVLLKRQEQEVRDFLREKLGGDPPEGVEVYTRRAQLLMDIERRRVRRLAVQSLDRLGSSREEIEAFLFELEMGGVELLSVRDSRA